MKNPIYPIVFVSSVGLLCFGCAENNVDEQPELASNIEATVTPTIQPIPTAVPTPTTVPTLTREERRKEAAKLAEAQRQAKKEKEKTEALAKESIAFDVPALMGKTIEQVRSKLGPIEDSGPEDDDGEMSWSNSKGGLLVHYDVFSRQVTSFFVNDQYGQPLSGKDQFLTMGNLKEDDSRYSLDFVPLGGSDTEWMGVRVLPN